MVFAQIICVTHFIITRRSLLKSYTGTYFVVWVREFHFNNNIKQHTGTTHFYFTHLTLHAVPFLYRHVSVQPYTISRTLLIYLLYTQVHRHHHESTNPGPWSSTWCSSAKRENFNNFSFSSFCHITQSTRISFVSLVHTTRKSLENQYSNAHSII